MFRPRIALFLAFLVGCTAGLFSQERPGWDALVELARAQSEAGDWAQAEQTYKTALAESQDEDPPVGLVVAAGSLGQLYRRQNRIDELETLHRGILASQERRFGTSDRRIAQWLIELGTLLAERDKYEEAEQLALRAVAIYEVQPAPHNRNIRAALRFLARLYQSQGRAEEATATARRVIESAEEQVEDAAVRFGDNHRAVAGTILELGQAYSEAGLYDQAEREMLRALKIYESSIEAYPELSIPYMAALRQMAQLYRVLGRDDASRELLARAESLHVSALSYERPAGDR